MIKKSFNMSFKMLLLAFSILLIVKATTGKIDCETSPLDSCGRPKIHDEFPREISEFKEVCIDIKSKLRCLKDWQDECGTDRITFFRTDEIFDGTYNTISDVCEEGTLLNSVASENLKCFNETFGMTRCRDESLEFMEPFYIKFREDEDFTPEFSISCLQETLIGDCLLRALSENCGKLVEEATMEFVRRSKALEYMCSAEGAQTVLDELVNMKLSEEKKKSVSLLLEKIAEQGITMGKIDCELSPHNICGRPKIHDEFPREVSEFNEICIDTKSNLRCTKQWQDECGTDRITFFRTTEIYEATYNTVSDLCEEGTLLNSVATENLKCFNETFGKTNCIEETAEITEPLLKEARYDADYVYKFSVSCLQETLIADCLLRALSEKCGKLVEEATLEFIRRSKSLEYICSEEGAQSVLDELDNLKFSEEKKKYVTLLLENIAEQSRD